MAGLGAPAELGPVIPFRVLVESSTHDDLHRGDCASGWSEVDVAASSAQEAQLLAAQIVACRRMPTRTAVRPSACHE